LDRRLVGRAARPDPRSSGRNRFWQEARAYFLLRSRKRSAEELRSCRKKVLEQVEELENLWRSGKIEAGYTS
jgi:hypothetical protein